VLGNWQDAGRFPLLPQMFWVWRISPILSSHRVPHQLEILISFWRIIFNQEQADVTVTALNAAMNWLVHGNVSSLLSTHLNRPARISLTNCAGIIFDVTMSTSVPTTLNLENLRSLHLVEFLCSIHEGIRSTWDCFAKRLQLEKFQNHFRISWERNDSSPVLDIYSLFCRN
jgi:hypothetical protein